MNQWNTINVSDDWQKSYFVEKISKCLDPNINGPDFLMHLDKSFLHLNNISVADGFPRVDVKFVLPVEDEILKEIIKKCNSTLATYVWLSEKEEKSITYYSRLCRLLVYLKPVHSLQIALDNKNHVLLKESQKQILTILNKSHLVPSDLFPSQNKLKNLLKDNIDQINI